MPTRFACGTRAAYVVGCRCEPCRQANCAYARERYHATRAGEGGGLVPAARARAHLERLSRANVGRRTVQDITGLGSAVLQDIRRGTASQIRASTERAILKVGADVVNDATLVPAEPTWKLIRKLLEEGFTRGELAVRLGYKRRALQLKRKTITARNALRVERFYRSIMQA